VVAFAVGVLVLVGRILTWLIVARAVLSWVRPRRVSPWLRAADEFLYETTEPVLAPIRRVLPPTGAFDLSPLVAIVVIYLLLLILQSVA
jgi:YggT family protein